MSAQEKPNGSLSNQDVYEIVQELDELIKDENHIQETLDIFNVNYSRSLARQVAYMKAKNLILLKI